MSYNNRIISKYILVLQYLRQIILQTNTRVSGWNQLIIWWAFACVISFVIDTFTV